MHNPVLLLQSGVAAVEGRREGHLSSSGQTIDVTRMALTPDITQHYPTSATEAGQYLGSGQMPCKHGNSPLESPHLTFDLMVSTL